MKDCHYLHLTLEEFKSSQLLIIMHSNYYEGLATKKILNIKEIGLNNWVFAIQILIRKLAQKLYIPIYKNFTLQKTTAL